MSYEKGLVYKIRAADAWGRHCVEISITEYQQKDPACGNRPQLPVTYWPASVVGDRPVSVYFRNAGDIKVGSRIMFGDGEAGTPIYTVTSVQADARDEIWTPKRPDTPDNFQE